MSLCTQVTAPIDELRSIFAYFWLDFWQRMYEYRFLYLPDSLTTKDIFLITLQTGDENTQSENQSDLDFIFASKQEIGTSIERVACQVSVRFSVILTE